MTVLSRSGRAPAEKQAAAVGPVENLLSASLVLGLFVSSFSVDAFGGSGALCRNLGLVVSLLLASAAVLVGFLGGRYQHLREERGRNLLALAVAGYFAWAVLQNLLLQHDLIGTATSVVAVPLVVGAVAADLPGLLAGLRRWLLIAVAAFLAPAAVGQGFETEQHLRVWLGFLPGRYFAFSNPNALGFLAGVAILLALPVMRQRQGQALALLAAILVALTASYTTVGAVALGLLAYFALGKAKNTGLLRAGVFSVALLTPALLLALPSDLAHRFLTGVSERFYLSGRALLWVDLARLPRSSSEFWIGVGDERLGRYVASVASFDAYTAHSTILQIFLSEGFLTAILFVSLAAAVSIRTLKEWESGRQVEYRVAFAVIVYWFVVSLASAQPGTALGFALIALMAVARPGADTASD